MDSNLNPLLLPKNQVAWASNMTVRGGFMTDRPPYTKQLVLTYTSPALQTAFEEGLFQGAGFYQPDSGHASLIAQVAGATFKFEINGDAVAVTDISVPADPNPAATTQVWMWQSENFMVINDGLSLPIFFNGSTSRRSGGASYLIATLDAGPYTAPAIGSNVTVSLTSPYTGPYDSNVLLHGAYYQPVQSLTGYNVDMENLTDVPGNPINVGDPVVIRGDVFGVQAVDIPVASGTYAPNGIAIVLTLTQPFALTVFNGAYLFGKTWGPVPGSITGNQVTIENIESVYIPPGSGVSFGQVILRTNSITANVIIGNVAVANVAPAAGATTTVELNSLYTGLPDQSVFIGDRQYLATPSPPPTPGLSLTLINLTDTDHTAGGLNNLPIYSVPELPAGRMGAYVLGQNWEALVDGLSYVASDISRGPSGTPSLNYRDACLKTTESTFNGGNFAIPGAGNIITSITGTTNLDTSLGQGSVMIGTPNFMASNLAPFDFTNPPATGPILTYSLIGQGPLGQDSTISVNSDIYFDSTYGIGSLIIARRDFSTPGNLPISAEMERILVLNDQSLMPYGSKIFFDNRLLSTCSPQASSQGVIFRGLVSENFDTLSSLRGKAPPCYDGLWTGLNILKLVTGIFDGVQRAFAFTFNVALSKLELWEILPTGTDHFDNESIPISWSFETGALFNKDVKPASQLCRLRDGEFAVDDVIGTVRFDVYYKPDQGCWTPWHSFSICADDESEPQYFPRLGLGEPDSTDCETVLNQSARDGYSYQVKFVISGHCRFLRLKLAAVTLAEPKFAPPNCDRIIEVEVTT